MIVGRWEVFVGEGGYAEAVVETPVLYRPRDHVAVRVVPCDEAAVERGARAVSGGISPTAKERRLAEAVLRAAGEAS